MLLDHVFQHTMWDITDSLIQAHTAVFKKSIFSDCSLYSSRVRSYFFYHYFIIRLLKSGIIIIVSFAYTAYLTNATTCLTPKLRKNWISDWANGNQIRIKFWYYFVAVSTHLIFTSKNSIDIKKKTISRPEFGSGVSKTAVRDITEFGQAVEAARRGLDIDVSQTQTHPLENVRAQRLPL